MYEIRTLLSQKISSDTALSSGFLWCSQNHRKNEVEANLFEDGIVKVEPIR